MLIYRGKEHTYVRGPMLDRGGMAEVYLGTRQDSPDKYVALKVPLTELDADVAALFLREAEAASRVSSNHAVRVLDWGSDPAFIALEYIEGPTLEKQLNERNRAGAKWSENELVSLFLRLCAGMSDINAEVIHRDIKPSNIFAMDDGAMKIADFGIAKYVGEVTRSKTFKDWGTPAYMAPETFRGNTVDWRCDQYALGAVFYEMATSQPPFSGDGDELQRQHLYQRPDSISGARPDLSQRLSSLVARMLEKRPEARFQSWTDLTERLGVQDLEGRAESSAVDESVVRIAADRLARLKQADLDEEDKARAKQALIERRAHLVEFWYREFLELATSEIDRLNDSLADNAISLVDSPGTGRASLKAGFLSGELNLAIQAVPPTEDGVHAWGTFKTAAESGVKYSSLYLKDDETPYGLWMEVEMNFNPMFGAFSANQEFEYEVFARSGVLPRNWGAFKVQIEKRNFVSQIQYSESPLIFERSLKEMLDFLATAKP